MMNKSIMGASFIFSFAVILVLVSGNTRVFKHEPTCNKLVGIYRTLAYLEDNCKYFIKSVLDVGANSGDWSNDLRNYFPQASFFLIEADGNNAGSLQKFGFQHEISLVGNKQKTVTYYKRNGETGNSMFKQFSWKDQTGVNVTMDTVDAIVERRKVGPFNFMKIDVQGAEVLALRGSRKTLKNVEVIAIEASIMNYNVGGASYFEILTTLESRGFALYDMFDMMRQGKDHGFVVQIDMLFVRKTSKLWDKSCTGFEPPQKWRMPRSEKKGTKGPRDSDSGGGEIVLEDESDNTIQLKKISMGEQK